MPIGVAKVAREGTDLRSSAGARPCRTRSPRPIASRPRTASRPRSSTCAASSRSTWRPVLASVRKTGRCVVASQAVLVGSFVNEIVARIQAEAFDYLDGPVGRIGAQNGISPQAESLEKAFLPNAGDIYDAAKGLL